MDIKVEKLSKTLGEVHVLDQIDIEVHQHEFVVILGPSGCGKSTLFNICTKATPAEYPGW